MAYFGSENKNAWLKWIVIAAIVVVLLWYLNSKGYLPF